MRFLCSFSILLILTAQSHAAGAPTNIQIFETQTIGTQKKYVPRIVSLPVVVSANSIATDFVEITTDQSIKSDSNGCLCVNVEDARSKYLEALWILDVLAKFHNGMLAKVGFSPMPKVSLNFQQVDGFQQFERARANGPVITYFILKDEFLPTSDVLAHEYGHIVHEHLAGDKKSSVRPNGPTEAMMQEGVIEGLANAFAVLFLGSAQISGMPINNFVRFPDQIITVEDTWSQSSSPYMKTQLDEARKSPDGVAMLKSPDPYFSSAAFTQPIFLASHRYGREAVAIILDSAVSSLHAYRSYSDLAKLIVSSAARERPEISDFLASEFKMRGL